MDQSNPGVIGTLVSNIIDNIQVKVTNIYVRIEDELSFPGHPYAMGVVIGSINAYSMNDSWDPQFISNKEIINK